MTQEQKNLLLKDLCSRLPYGVKGVNKAGIVTDPSDWYCGFVRLSKELENRICFSDWKPYLFPLDSITIEQERELSKLGVSYCEYALHDDTRGLGIMVDEAYIFFEFCYKHHIDFLGLIDMGVAIDATGKNIY